MRRKKSDWSGLERFDVWDSEVEWERREKKKVMREEREKRIKKYQILIAFLSVRSRIWKRIVHSCQIFWHLQHWWEWFFDVWCVKCQIFGIWHTWWECSYFYEKWDIEKIFSFVGWQWEKEFSIQRNLVEWWVRTKPNFAMGTINLPIYGHPSPSDFFLTPC